MYRTQYSRRDFLESTLKAGAVLPVGALLSASAQKALGIEAQGRTDAKLPSLIDADFREIVSHADLDYTQPVTRSEEGQPIGNGRMGSLVWTTPASLKFQINRVDVFAENCETNSFPERHTDYGSGCGYVDIDCSSFGDEVFTGTDFNQHLHVYDGMMTLSANQVTIRALAQADSDVIAVEIDDKRGQPMPITVDLRMLRYMIQYIEGKNYALENSHSVAVVTRNQTATSALGTAKSRITLKQEFREGDYYNASAIAIEAIGRRAKASYANESTVRLSLPPGRGKVTVLIGSAASFDPKEDIVAKAASTLDPARGQSFDLFVEAHKKWWHSFWSKAFVRIDSKDETAREIERNYTYFLYVFASSSRGEYMPRFGGLLWFTNGDMREWGAQHWWANASCYYNAVPAANRPELMHPFLAMYSSMYESCALAAKQQWHSKGIYIPETVWFDGLEKLPDDIATEMADLYLLKKDWEQRSERFRYYAEPKAPHNSRWNWKDKGAWVDGHYVWKDRGMGPYGPVTHIFGSSAKIAHLYWQHYEYTQNAAFLQAQCYPIVKGIAEFYRNFPNLIKEADGKYHIHRVNNHEPVQGARDTQEEISAMRGIFPVAIKAARILGVDPDLCTSWTEVLDNLAPHPTNALPDSPRPRGAADPELWIAGLPPVIRGNIAALNLVPAHSYDLCTTNTEDKKMLSIAAATFDASYPQGINADTPVSELDGDGTVAANLGRGEAMRYFLVNQIRNVWGKRPEPEASFAGAPPSILANRMTLREGPGAIGVERLGRMSEALHAALLQSGPARPGGDPILHVFPAWPKDWDTQFKLAARGGFLVTSSWKGGTVEFVEVHSRAGRDCQLRNPWGTGTVAVYRNGRKEDDATGAIFQFATQAEDVVIIVPHGGPLPRA